LFVEVSEHAGKNGGPIQTADATNSIMDDHIADLAKRYERAGRAFDVGTKPTSAKQPTSRPVSRTQLKEDSPFAGLLSGQRDNVYAPQQEWDPDDAYTETAD
jgi:hypothetical protein